MEFDEQGNLQLTDWHSVSETEDAVLEEVELPEAKKAYSILCGPGAQCVASWRCKVLLAKGCYVLHANCQTSEVESTEDEKGRAAGVRISGSQRTNKREGTSKWAPIDFEFTVDEEIRDVELVAELRATRGQVWFEAESLRLNRKVVESPDK